MDLAEGREQKVDGTIATSELQTRASRTLRPEGEHHAVGVDQGARRMRNEQEVCGSQSGRDSATEAGRGRGIAQRQKQF